MKELNKDSRLLTKAVIGGAGLQLPPDAGLPPEGMGAILLYVPLDVMKSMTLPDIQADIGLPWSGPDGEPFWLSEEDVG